MMNSKIGLIAFKLILFLIILSTPSCFIFRGSQKKRKKPVTSYRISTDSQEKEIKKDVYDIENEATSAYFSACVFENQFYERENRSDAINAINKFERYYNLLPDGTYAGLSLLKIVELSYHLGDLERAKYELDRIKGNYKLRVSHNEEIKLIESLFNE